MNHRSTAKLLAAAALLPGAAAAQADHQPDEKRFLSWSDLMGKGSTFKLYGFIRADLQYDDSRFNDPQIPGFVRSEDPAAPAAAGALNDDDEMAIHPRLTRLGLDFNGPEMHALGAPALTGNVEIDFYNIGLNDNDSRTAIRMRRAFLNLDWGQWSFLAGQEWDLISPLYPAVNHDLVMWGAGNLGDRRAQFRGQFDGELGAGTFTATAGIGMSGAVDSPAVVGGLRAGENSGAPMTAARVAYSGKNAAGGAWQLGVWGHLANEDFAPAPGAREATFTSRSVGADFKLPILDDDLWLMGEVFQGENLDDVRGGIFQGVNAAGQEIGGKGGWAELGLRVSATTTLHAGYSNDNPDDADLGPAMRSNNKIAYAAARFKFDAVHVGVEYLNWVTEYIGLDQGDANRLAAYVAFYF